ncbi:hypothetical protein QVD17_35169 [Tagetes erecta]|uniref:Uncharacterized protein n=1 Tax=Tagetes erecta TaxID=13708 RepID=A0AAD8K322_TARER|nr:hypothetical protein QVD17_35169 [Tagetes erecta]
MPNSFLFLSSQYQKYLISFCFPFFTFIFLTSTPKSANFPFGFSTKTSTLVWPLEFGLRFEIDPFSMDRDILYG